MLRNSARRAITAIAITAVVGVLGAIPALAAPANPQNTQVVTNSDVARQPENTPPTKNWVLYTRNGGTGTFVNGPATPPAGTGSLELNTPTGADKVFLFNYDQIGTPLSDITDMGYSTYRETGQLQQDAAINLEVDVNGPDVAGGFTTLVFEPVYNTDQGTVVDGQWQNWDAYNGGSARWWSTKTIPGVCSFDCFVSWSDIVAANPDATILGGFGVNQGSGNPGLVTDVDALHIGTASGVTTYDFERGPVTKDQCKNGGWTQYQNPSFKNQGDCVSFVASGK